MSYPTYLPDEQAPYAKRQQLSIPASAYRELTAISELLGQAVHKYPGNAELKAIEARLGALIATHVPI